MRYSRNQQQGSTGGGMGGGCLPHMGCSTGNSLTPLCDITKVTSVLRGQAAATTFTLTQQIQRCNFFQPCAVRFWAIDGATASTRRTVEIHQVEINSCAQECGSAAELALATVDMIALLDDYTVVDFPFGVPVCWGTYARAAFAETLRIGGANVDVAAIDFYSTNWGNACPALPPGCELGTPGTRGYK